jgi:hypothetical protein
MTEDRERGRSSDDARAVTDGGDVVGERGDDDLGRGLDRQDDGEVEPGQRTTIGAAATEKSVETTVTDMNSGQDGSGGGEDRQTADRSADDGLDLEAALSEAFDGAEDGDVIERTGTDTHRAVGEGDPDAVFETFEEDDPQDVIDAAEGDAAAATAAAEDTVDAVDGLFEDLGGVDTDPVETDAGASAEAGTATESAAGAEPAPEETAGEVEGLLDDLTTVEVDADAAATESATAHTEPTVLDPEETGATGFQWLGEDIRIFPSDGGDPDAVLDEFEDSPETIVAAAESDAGVSATALFEDMADGSVDHPDRPEATGGWGGDGARASVGATDLLDRVGAAADGVTVTGTGTADESEPAAPGDTTATGEDAEATDAAVDQALDSLTVGEEDTESESDGVTTFGTDSESGTADDPDLDLDVDLGAESDAESTEEFEVDIDLEDVGDGSGFDADAETETADASTAAGAETGTAEESAFDLDLESTVEETEPAATSGAGQAEPAAGTDDAGETTVEPAEPATTAGEASTPKGAVAAESDVDAMFERMDADSPEAVVEAAADPAAETETDSVTASDERVEQLFGDLSAVSLTPSESESVATETGPAPEPGSEETVAAIEGLLGEMSAADVPDSMTEDSPPESETDQPTFAAEEGTATDLGGDTAGDDLLEQTGEDTHVAVGESEIDAFFERFSEDSPEEIVESARVPPLEELSERDPEQVREDIAGAGTSEPERAPEVGDDDPVEVLGPDGESRERTDDSLSGTIRDDLGGEEPAPNQGQGQGQRGHEHGGSELGELDPDDIFEGAGGDRRETTDPDRAGEPAATAGEDLVSDAERATDEPAGRTNSERVGETLAGEGDGAEAAETETGSVTETDAEAEAEAGAESESTPTGLVGRLVAAVRSLF